MAEVVAEFSVTPITQGDMKPFIDTAVHEIQKAGLHYEVGPVGTAVEGDLDQVINAIRNAHQAVLDKGVDRVITEMRLDEKRGGISMAEEIEGYR